MKAHGKNTLKKLVTIAWVLLTMSAFAHHEKGSHKNPHYHNHHKKKQSETSHTLHPYGFVSGHYLYNPEYKIYFHIEDKRYIYPYRDGWISSTHLPKALNHREVRDGFTKKLVIYGAPHFAKRRHTKPYRRYVRRRYLACGD